jgi:hypothetical protein
MKGSAQFENKIKEYLDNRAATDELFAKMYSNPKKKFEDCIAYILNTVMESGCNGFDDPEIYSMAVHYYNEENVKVGKLPENMSIVVNHHVELTDKEKEEAKQKAIDDLIATEKSRLSQKQPKAKQEQPKVQQPSLFD